MKHFHRIAVIGNPAAKSGAGAEAARHVAQAFSHALGPNSTTLLMTSGPTHATQLAASLDHSFDTVVAVGGDGILHEIAKGLMQRPSAERPVLGVVPVGSGNDYAASLDMPTRIDRAVEHILTRRIASADVGLCNNEPFVETLSFGLDAAIALDTVERRHTSGRSGTLLYLESGIDQLLHHLDEHRYHASFSPDMPGASTSEKRATAESGASVDGASRQSAGAAYLFAVQVGPTYGGHFRICPQALIDDGLLDICIAHPPLSVPRALGLLLLAKNGHHTRFKQLEFRRARSLHVEFAHELPVQADGEKMRLIGQKVCLGQLFN